MDDKEMVYCQLSIVKKLKANRYKLTADSYLLKAENYQC